MFFSYPGRWTSFLFLISCSIYASGILDIATRGLRVCRPVDEVFRGKEYKLEAHPINRNITSGASRYPCIFNKMTGNNNEKLGRALTIDPDSIH